MVTTVANEKSANRVNPPKIHVVNSIPALGNVEIGEMFLLISDSDTHDKKIHIKVATGWLRTAALS